MPCIPLKVNRPFGGTCCFRLQGRIRQARNQRKSKWKRSCRTVLRNVGRLSTDYVALCARRYNPSNHRCNNLRSYIHIHILRLQFHILFYCIKYMDKTSHLILRPQQGVPLKIKSLTSATGYWNNVACRPVAK
jgi:hypothetical protein